MAISSAAASWLGHAEWQLMLYCGSLKNPGCRPRARIWLRENICGTRGCFSGALRRSWKTWSDFYLKHTPRLRDSPRLLEPGDMRPRCGEFIRVSKTFLSIMR